MGSLFARVPERVWRDTAIAGIVFQVIHFIEHGAQLGYWVIHPTAAPWLTPWAASGRNILATGSSAAIGNEFLHLIGNAIFFVGLIGLCAVYERGGSKVKDFNALRIAVLIQGFHLFEHVLLTTSTVAFGKALGVSTVFGTLSGATLSTTRVWFHFLINLAATIYAVKAIRGVHEKGLLIQPARGVATA